MEQMPALRAAWLALLAEAIDGAQRLAWQLGMQEPTSMEARQLYGQLEAARVELDSLRGLAVPPMHDIDPNWLQKLGWAAPQSDPAV
jgi:hypothetical protein